MTTSELRPGHYAAAKKLGARTYYGQPCNWHDGAPRYTANRRCVECVRAERLARAQADPERERQRKRKPAKPAQDHAPACSPLAALFMAAMGAGLSTINENSHDTHSTNG
jgi:hypothetical protein